LSKGLISRTSFQKYVGLTTLSSEVGNAALKQMALSLFAKCNRGTRGGSRGGVIGAIAPRKTEKVTFFAVIFYNSENNTRDTRTFCRPLFCRSCVVKYTSSVLQQWTRNKTQLPNITEIAPPPKLTGWIRHWVALQPLKKNYSEFCRLLSYQALLRILTNSWSFSGTSSSKIL